MGQILKPLTVTRQEFIESLKYLINTSNLPPFVVEDVMRETLRDVSALAKQQLEIDTKKYQEALEKANTKNVALAPMPELSTNET